jgi:hypothetical protein
MPSYWLALAVELHILDSDMLASDRNLEELVDVERFRGRQHLKISK